MKEIWLDVVDYNGLYQISNIGRVKRLNRICCYKGVSYKEKILKQNKNSDGYLQIRLTKGKIRKTFRVHRLVAQAFIPNPENKPRVNHIDNDRANNVLSNLEWATHQEDVDHKCSQNRQHRPSGEKNPMFGLKGEKNPSFGKSRNAGSSHGFARLVLDKETGIFYECLKDAAAAKGYNAGTLYNRLCGNRKNNTSLIFV